MTCTVDGCGKPVKATALCGMHYERRRLHGRLDRPGAATVAFLRRVVADPPDDCVLWPYSRTAKGYGYLTYERRSVRAHRLALLLAAGPPPEDRPIACHSCDTPSCVNPRHLRWDTPQANSADMVARGRSTLARRS